MTPVQLDKLVQSIHADLAREPKGPKVAQRLARYAEAHGDWKEFALFDEGAYARNLVHKDELFELIVLCWGAGQQSPIHNHQGQRCWMAVLEGQIQETLFRVPTGKAKALIASPSKLFAKGSVAFITDDIALHRIAPAKGKPAVSLHLYSRPIDQCQIYDPTTGEIALRSLAYSSIRGVRQPVGVHG